MNFKGRTVVITGGSSGIGAELVDQLTDQCKEIIVLARGQSALDALYKKYSNVTCYACNLDNRHDLELVIDMITKKHSEVSVFINNAGIQNVPTFLDDQFNYGGIELEVKINLLAPMWITALILGHFIEGKQEAAFINITSGLAIYPKTTSAVYCATKAGLRSFSKSLRYQLEGSNVSVFEAVMPIVDTPMTRGRGRKKMKPSEAAKALIRGVENDKHEILIGISRLIPIMSRISPRLMAGILKRG